MSENGTKSINFPATNAAGEAKLKRLVETIAEYMGGKVTIETVIVLQANYPNDRPDIEAVLKRLSGIKTGLRMTIKENSSVEQTVEKGE